MRGILGNMRGAAIEQGSPLVRSGRRLGINSAITREISPAPISERFWTKRERRGRRKGPEISPRPSAVLLLGCELTPMVFDELLNHWPGLRQGLVLAQVQRDREPA